MESLIKKLQEIENDFKTGIYSAKEYNIIRFELSKALNKTGVKF